MQIGQSALRAIRMSVLALFVGKPQETLFDLGVFSFESQEVLKESCVSEEHITSFFRVE
jgi:hypothetical protein